LLPDVAYGARVPMVLAAHGTIGIADECAPSRFVREGIDVTGLPPDYIDALLLSYAARGLPVVAPDYAGLGTEGTHGYDNWLDPARSAIDGVRALRALIASDRLDGTTIAYGHSQGGGIVLALAGLREETPDVDLRAIVSLAPGYRVSTLRSATALSGFPLNASLWTFASLAVLSGYANLTDDSARWGEPFRAGIRDHLVSQLTTLCIGNAIESLDMPTADYTPPTTIGEALDPDFVSAVSACSSGGACDGLPGAWVARDIANEPRTPASSPPILLVLSNGDTVNVPPKMACSSDSAVCRCSSRCCSCRARAPSRRVSPRRAGA
jgi:pimeloyl-ACP methyl ester carboxylesterase